MKQKRKSNSYIAILAVVVFFMIMLAIVVSMHVKNTDDLYSMLEDSVKNELLSVSVAAREIIDSDAFASYNSLADVAQDQEAYDETLMHLRALCRDANASYIYALKQIDGGYYFVFDTDTEDEEVFIEYDLSPVHEAAFLGRSAADVMNVDDIYGTFNTGAVPIWKDGRVIGIVSVDIEDELLQKSAATARRNVILLIVMVVATMAVMLIVVWALLRRLSQMHGQLEHMAHYDLVTGLPNRQYLMDFLTRRVSTGEREPFALFFVDVDNFKAVNDEAGHDAGDELLHGIAQYLGEVDPDAIAFRPAAGHLNIAARVGGDEFIQVVNHVSTEIEAAKIAQRLLDGFHSGIFQEYIERYHVGLSIGVSLYPIHSEDFNVLIKYADIAMYNAKRAGKNSFRVYTKGMTGKEEK